MPKDFSFTLLDAMSSEFEGGQDFQLIALHFMEHVTEWKERAKTRGLEHFIPEDAEPFMEGIACALKRSMKGSADLAPVPSIPVPDAYAAAEAFAKRLLAFDVVRASTEERSGIRKFLADFHSGMMTNLEDTFFHGRRRRHAL
ncbi:MAG: hypothetical protein V4681_01580 [Patescibacteria group bacterium]